MELPRFPRVSLGHLPTRLEPLDKLSETLGGPPLFIKRDDCTGLALGGNKTRKLEFLLADALEAGADTVITAGGLQSNHVRQTAAAANKLGLGCHLVLQRYVDWKDTAYLESGNLMLDGLLGASTHFPSPDTPRDTEMERVAEELRGQGAKPYVIPGGGSNAIGGLGYASAAGELLDQAQELGCDVSHVIVPSANGGTQGGLVAGFTYSRAAIGVTGINVDVADAALLQKTIDVANGTAALLGVNPDLAENVSLISDYGGDGYGQPTPKSLEAIHLLAKLEGIILDPVYSGKAMAGLIDLVRTGQFDSDRVVVFIHTGGVPGLFAYPSLFPRVVPGRI